MFDVLDDLEVAVGKLLASEPCGEDLERVSSLCERMEFARLRLVGAFDRSGVWAAESFVSTASAMRSKLRCSHGYALRSVRLARKLEDLTETAAAFSAGEITAEHVVEMARPYTPARAEMLQGIEAELVAFARIGTPRELREVVKGMCDAFDGDKGARNDEREHALNKVTLSATSGGRGILNGSLDAELTDIVLTALDAEMEMLRVKGEVRKTPELRAAALESIMRKSLASRSDSTARGRGQAHVNIVTDVLRIAGSSPALADIVRAETAHGGMLSRNTLERISCDCKISRIITDGPSSVLDVGRMTRAIPAPLWNALVARDRHCTANGCKRPPSMCEGHHIRHWANGGPTNLENLRLLCWFHHKEQHIHDAQARAG
jgi:hypothetical protein